MNDSIISSKALKPVILSKKRNNGAKFTIKSLVTGKEYTYSISRKEWNDVWYTNIHVEVQYGTFKKLGYYKDGNLFNKGKVTTPAAIAIAWVLKKVEESKFELLDKNINIMHTGCCLKCGRLLTDSQSIEIGLGPVCVK